MDDKGDDMDDKGDDDSQKTDVEKKMDVTGAVPLNTVYIEAYNEEGLVDFCRELHKLGYSLHAKGMFFSFVASKMDDEGDDDSQKTDVVEKKMDATGAVPLNTVYIEAENEEGLVGFCKELHNLGYSLRAKKMFFSVVGSKIDDKGDDDSQKTDVVEKKMDAKGAVPLNTVYIEAENEEGLVDFCRELHQLGYLLHAKRRTAKFLREHGLTVFLTSEILTFEEFLKLELDDKAHPEDDMYFKISGMAIFSVFVINRRPRCKFGARSEADRQAGRLYNRLVNSALEAAKVVIVNPSDYLRVLAALHKSKKLGKELYRSFNNAFYFELHSAAVGSLRHS